MLTCVTNVLRHSSEIKDYIYENILKKYFTVALLKKIHFSIVYDKKNYSLLISVDT